jgi:hypothetical protein
VERISGNPPYELAEQIDRHSGNCRQTTQISTMIVFVLSKCAIFAPLTRHWKLSMVEFLARIQLFIRGENKTGRVYISSYRSFSWSGRVRARVAAEPSALAATPFRPSIFLTLS